MTRESAATRSCTTPRRRLAGAAPAAILLCGLVGGLSGCRARQLQSQSPSYLIIDSLEGASGVTPSNFGGTLGSDTVTMVKQQDASGKTVLVPTIYEDPGEAKFELAMTDPGSVETPNRPTSTNVITITRYHVQYVRTDGRNTPGVDVPYPFDAAMTVSVTSEGTTGGFTLVRQQAKEEAPLEALDTNGNVIATIAQVTFYGTDQAGNAASVTGQISVDFSNFGDPQ